jgi:uncharacterized membrane protein YphA (DoxX/SURF4 family)
MTHLTHAHPVRANPSWVDAILEWRWTWPLARVALTSAYWVGGFTKLFDFSGAVAEQAHFGINPPALFAALTIIVELVGSALVISGRWLWLGAGALGIFTAVATLIAHPFWAMEGHERFLATNAFFEHLGLIGAFVIAALFAEGVQRRKTPP